VSPNIHNCGPDKLAVLIVDDHAVVRQGLRTILNANPRLEVVGEAADGDEACASAAALNPHIVIMDVLMPTLNGADATRRLLELSPGSRVIVLTAHEETPYIRELLAAGARGYVLKRALVKHLIRAIDVVAAGGVFVDPTLGHRLARTSPPESAALSAELTNREVTVASMVASGHSNLEIAAELELSVKTVETHKTRLMAKLGLSTRPQLVRYAIYRGWLTA
jgi:DNA-binding NarL/FixJ family response regulator